MNFIKSNQNLKNTCNQKEINLRKKKKELKVLKNYLELKFKNMKVQKKIYIQGFLKVFF